MKRLDTLLLPLAAMLAILSCSKKQETTPESVPEGPRIVLNTAAKWNQFHLPAYIGDLSAYPADLQTVINDFFPRRSTLEDAKVLFVGAGELTANAAALADAADRGAFVVFPGSVDAAPAGLSPVVATFEEASAYTPLFHCHSNWGQGVTYTLWAEPEVEEPEDVTPSMTEAQWKELVKRNQSSAPESGVVLSDYDNEPDFNKNYYQTRMHVFVEWLENALLEQTLTKAESHENMKASIENLGQRLTHNFPYSLSKTIDKGTLCDPDVLSKSGSLDVEFRIYPCYLQSSNGDKAGDYYAVVSTVTPHNASMWGPFVGSHGGCRNRVYGFWFNKMVMSTSLVNSNNTPISGLEYYDRPIPENKNSSKEYSNGKSVSVTGTLSGGYGGKQAGGVGSASLSVGGTWTSSTNYTLETIDYSLDSSTPTVKYSYSTNNVKLTDDYDNWDKINNEDFPAPVRTEFSSHAMWTWHVPGSTVRDGSLDAFRLKTKITINYASWYHWRGSAEFDGNKKDYDIDLPEISWNLKSPDRTPWGFIRLRNASTNYEMAHVSFYRSGEESGTPVATLSYSYSKGDDARMALAEGTYSVKWDLIDGTTQEKYGSYIYRNVKVHQGANVDAATVSISSVDAEKL